jgi:NAD(P)-dependent dehydrogenase (short-subunit alcohol dehydrogenase family)
MRGLKDKAVIVAGGATGIGAATALRLAQEGASVVIGDIDLHSAQALAQEIEDAGGAAIAVAFDIADDASVKNLVDTAVERYGGIDGMHANAADMSLLPKDGDALGLSLDLWDRTMAVNLRGHLLCTRNAVPALLARGGGAIVYTSSGAAYVGEPARVAYAVAKSGINALMRHVASRWGKEGIRANAVAPGVVMTENALRTMLAERRSMLLSQTRSARLGRTGDIATMIAMLMSDDGEWINGQVVSVDGGITMR